MQPETSTIKDPQIYAGSSHSLLQYEINRVKSHMDIHGESHAMRERLRRLEALLQTCLATSPGDKLM